MPKEIKKELSLYVYQKNELSTEVQSLLQNAHAAAENARAPYSEFKVGAALMLEDGTVVLGNNQENAAYPSGLCAERVAFFSAKANNPKARVLKVAIVALKMDADENNIPAPCGSCRQVMSEYEVEQESDIAVYLTGGKGKVLMSKSIDNLLPFKFSVEQLS
ncbi:cytidine deaminase [Roseivirga sp.]|uniref:cytidine deaminase n=1 Tax=Roseivirga sp. TaxID=1964215 RepID=UPI003B8B0424